MKARLTLSLAALAILATSAEVDAQRYREETNRDLGITYLVHEKLSQVPERIGTETSHLIQKFRPDSPNDNISGKLGSYEWYTDVYRFNKTGRGGGDGVDGPTTGGDDDEELTPEEILRRARQEALADGEANSFEEYVRSSEKDPLFQERQFVVEAKERGGNERQRRPDARVWEFYDIDRRTWLGEPIELIWYSCAAVYDLGETEVAVVVRCPIPKSGRKLPSKYQKIAYKTILSVTLVEEEDLALEEDDEEKDKYADTPEKKKMLGILKENLRDIRNRWDYFTLPHYIVTYSWEEPNSRDDRVRSHNYAVWVSKKVEAMRERYQDYYPMHEGMEENYSIIRVCSNYDEFSSYGNTPRGVAGWFSPGTKELVIFFDRDKLFDSDPQEFTLGVLFHEAWHQYSDQWWPNARLHRWFDEGLAEFFNAQRQANRSGTRWEFGHNDGRIEEVEGLLRRDALLPTEKIITLPQAQFGSPQYAQAWVMVDFLIRGKERLGRAFDESWEKILPTYGEECLKGTDPTKAMAMAFEGVDIAAYDAAWLKWFEDRECDR